MSLPPIPSPGPPQIGPQGSVYPQAPGTLPYSTTGPAIVQGISQFMNNFTQMRQAERDRYHQMFESGVQNMMAGIPVDTKKLAKYAKRANLPINFEEPTQLDVEHKAMNAMQASLASGASQVPGPSGAGIQQAAKQSPMAQPPPQAQPGLLDRLKQGLLGGGGGPIGPNSPGMQWLQQMKSMGADENEVRKNILNIKKSALLGDPKGVEMATRMGLFHAIGPRDEMTMLMRKSGMSDEAITAANMYMYLGGAQSKEMVWKMAGEMAPRFGGDFQKALSYTQKVFSGEPTGAGETPGMSFDELDKRGRLTWEMMKENPFAPPQEVAAAAEAMTSPGQSGQQVGQALAQHLGQYPRKEGIDFLKWSQEMQQKVKFHTDNMGVEWSRLAQEKQIHEQSFALQQLNSIRQAAGQQFESWWKVREDKNAPQDEKDAATTGLADAMKKMNIPGVTAKKLDGLWGTVSGGLLGKTGKNVLDLPAPNFKSPNDASEYWKKIMKWWTEPDAGLNIGEDSEDAIWFRKHMMDNAPPQLRK